MDPIPHSIQDFLSNCPSSGLTVPISHSFIWPFWHQCPTLHVVLKVPSQTKPCGHFLQIRVSIVALIPSYSLDLHLIIVAVQNDSELLPCCAVGRCIGHETQFSWEELPTMDENVFI